LTHTSGLVSGGPGMRKAPPGLSWPTSPKETLASYLPRFAAVPLDFQPGTRWRYSPHAGIDALARVVEVASRQSFAEFLRRRTFAPLGMKDTSFVLPDDRRKRLASIYEVSPRGLKKARYTVIPFPRGYYSGAVGLVSTAEDYLRFAQMLLARGRWRG